MCGIVGYAGGKSASAVCYEGLKRLEYRGYDSAGIAVLNCGKINMYKSAGRVHNVCAAVNMGGGCGIGHTRWATHGKPVRANAHPHLSGKFAVVHNGIIENYRELKAELEGEGYAFLSETDSETAAHLINKYYDGDPVAAVRRAAGRLKGSYALCVLCEDFEGIIAVKYKSPLILGYGGGENMVASDVPALAGIAAEVSALSDGDLAVVTAGGIEIFAANGRRVNRRRVKNPVRRESLSTDGYPHYMIKEINQTPQSIINTVQAVKGELGARLKRLICGVDEVILTGCGTAFNSGLAAVEYFKRAGFKASAVLASEFRYSNPALGKNALVIAVSQSGETADTVEAARLAARRGARVIAVTNVPYSAVTRAARFTLPVRAGTEICVAATKSYTGQIAALYMLAGFMAGRQERAEQELLLAAEKLQKFLKNSDCLHDCASVLSGSSAVFFLGRGMDYAAAREGSLKLKEVSYIFSDGYAAGELKHGTLALIDDKTCSVVLITQRRLAEKCSNAVEQIASRGGKIIVITSLLGVEKRLGERALTVRLPACKDELSVLFTAVCCQLFAYFTAVTLGRNPDKPRNLAKSVTVE